MTTGRINQVATIDDLVGRARIATPKERPHEHGNKRRSRRLKCSTGRTGQDAPVSIACTASEREIDSHEQSGRAIQFGFPPRPPREGASGWKRVIRDAVSATLWVGNTGTESIAPKSTKAHDEN